jgi:pyruvate, water dikinase
MDYSTVLEEHDSFFIGSDVFLHLPCQQRPVQAALRLTRNSQISPEEFDKVEERFLAGRFPDEIMEQFKDLLDYFGQAPIIVRSSSLLEDGFGTPLPASTAANSAPIRGAPKNGWPLSSGP